MANHSQILVVYIYILYIIIYKHTHPMNWAQCKAHTSREKITIFYLNVLKKPGDGIVFKLHMLVLNS